MMDGETARNMYSTDSNQEYCIALHLVGYTWKNISHRIPSRDSRFSAMLRTIDWQLLTEVSVQRIKPIFMSQAEQETWDFLALEAYNDRSYRNVGK
jgi:hypothetical protein